MTPVLTVGMSGCLATGAVTLYSGLFNLLRYVHGVPDYALRTIDASGFNGHELTMGWAGARPKSRILAG